MQAGEAEQVEALEAVEDSTKWPTGASCSWRKRAGAQHWLTTMERLSV